MLSTFRHIQKGTLIVVTIIIVIAFAFLYSDFDFARGTLGTTDCVIKVYNRCYRVDEAQKLARFQDLAFNLRMMDFASTLRGPDRLDSDPTDFVMNLLILRKEAERLGIEPTAEEIKNAVPELPIFKQIPWANGTSVRNILGQLGLDEGDLAQLTKDYLSFQKLQNLIGAGIQGVPTQAEKLYTQENQRYTASIITFKRSDFEEQAEVTEEEIRKYFDDRQPDFSMPETVENAENSEGIPEQPRTSPPKPEGDQLFTDPRRGFDFVKFVPGELGEDATAEEKAKSSVAFAKAVNRIYSELSAEGADFLQVARDFAAREKEFKIELGTFEPFTESDPPEEIADDAQLVPALFSGTLTEGQVSVPYSGGEDGSYYVFHFNKGIDPRPMTFEEAKPVILESLKQKKSNQLANEAAIEAKTKLQEALEQGKSILDAASANGYDLVSLPVFSEADRPDVEDPHLVVQSVRGTAAGKLSDVMERPREAGYFFTHVEKIEIYKDENKESALRMITASSELSEKQDLFLAWLRNRASQSGAARNNSVLAYPARR